MGSSLGSTALVFLPPRLAGAALARGQLFRGWRYDSPPRLRELGSQYSALLTIQAEHQLIQTGLYSRIRHPFYLGQVVAEPRIMFALRSPLAILIVAASLPFVVKRMNREEQVLLDHFGDRYHNYCARTYRLLPHIY